MTDGIINPGGGTATNSSFPVGSVYSWNGPVCQVCGQGYIGSHMCKVSVLKDKIAELEKLIDEIEGSPKKPMECHPVKTDWTRPQWSRDTSGCSCRPENGGSGVCGCIFGGPQITC